MYNFQMDFYYISYNCFIQLTHLQNLIYTNFQS